MNKKTETIINQQWVEAPQRAVNNLPTTRKNYLPVPAHQPVREKPQVRPQRQIDPARVEKLVNRQLVFLMDDHMMRMKIKEVYGRIALVDFVPMQATDPIMPLPLVSLDNYGRHNRAWRELARLLMQIEPTWWGVVNTGRWLHKARKQVQIIADEAQKFLTDDEWMYYFDQLQECVANPQRRGF